MDRQGEPHRHVALVADGRAATATHRTSAGKNRFSLLRLSLGERLIMVAVLSTLLWVAVYWALR